MGDIYAYMNPFWSDDGTTIGFAEVHNASPNKIVVYDLSTAGRSYIYEPVAPLDASNPDFLGGSKTTIIFWDIVSGAADLFTWDGTTRTNITNTTDYKEYEPVSNADGTKIVYWSGETTVEPVNTTHTLTYSGGSWSKDINFTAIADSYWSTWTTSAANQIALTVMSSKDIHIYDNTGNFVADLSGSGYSGGSGQWNFFGTIAQGPNGEYIITSNAGRTTSGRDIVKVTKTSTTTASTPTSKPLTPEEQASLNLSIAQQVDLYGATNIGFTKMLYDNILGRVSDAGGLDDWVTALNNGTITLGDVVYGFVFSKELEPIISVASSEEFITFLYENVLDRNADPDGFNNWLTLMQNGMTKEEVLLHFIDSGEFKNICEMFGLKP
ncbi:MAG: DUF4214 domain-containing protein [Candidatus Humimicrobiaceae bacterium]